MRFDDRLATVLGYPAPDAPARDAAWCQLVDLLAQSAGDGDGMSDTAREAYLRLRAWRHEVPAATRLAVARALAGHRIPAELVRFFADDAASIAAPVIGSVRLPAEEWVALIPQLTPTARALLRHRRDLDPRVERALAHYGQSDLVISGPEPAAAGATPPEETQPRISDLVARIEAYRREHHPPPLVSVEGAGGEPLDAFAFETDWEGTIDWVDADDRGPLIGLSLAAAAELFGQGFDGQAAGAFRRRAAFRDARLVVSGQGGAAGEWRVSGVPFFDDRSGRFLGYRGKARRPRFAERAEPARQGLYGSNLTPESLRSLAHELRTPLNAIVGFAEMIDKQILGPVSSEYRARAAAILAEARRLADAVDDLDSAARVESQTLRQEPGAIDAAALLARIGRQIAPRGSAARIDVAPHLPPVAGDRASVERMFARLVAAALALGEPGERLAVTLGPDPHGGGVRLSVDRPTALGGRSEQELLDPGYSPEGDWPDAPLLGLGFSLRLVRSLAEANGGRLLVEPGRFLLLLPAAGVAAEENLVQS